MADDWFKQYEVAPAESTRPANRPIPPSATPTDWAATLDEVMKAAPPFLASQLSPIASIATQIRTKALGVPGAAMVGLAAGGGEALNQLSSRFLFPGEGRTWMNPSNPNAPADPQEALNRIRNAMLLNTLLSPMGQSAAAGIPAKAERMAEHAIHPSPALQRMYPEIGPTVIRERMKVGPGRMGQEAAEGAIQAAQGEVEKAIASLPKGTMFNRDAVLARVYDFIEEQGKAVLSPKERKEMAQKFLSDLGYAWHGRKATRIGTRKVQDLMTPEEVRELMRQADAEAQRIYQSWAKSSTSMPTDVQLGESFSLALRRGAKDVLARESPQFSKALERLSRLHGAKAAIAESEMASVAGQVPGGSRVYLPNVSMHGELLSPRVRNRIALLMATPQFQNVIRTSPQAAMLLIQNMMRMGQE